MLGPLPPLHRRTLALGVVALFLVAGVVAGVASIVPVVTGTAVAVAGPLGLAVAFLLVHDFSAGRGARARR